jgi:hypothetical protein
MRTSISRDDIRVILIDLDVARTRRGPLKISRQRANG